MILTIVNLFANHLIFKNGIFFDLLKRCLYSFNVEKNNKNLNFLLTLLTA